jgi:hypothetical protein
MINDTGAASVKGTLVQASKEVDNGVILCLTTEKAPIGVIYEDGVAVGSDVYVVVTGVAKILLEDDTASTHGYWVVLSAITAGRIDATQPTPPNESELADHSLHFDEVGHCLESVSAGTDKLAKCIIHFN